MRGRQIAQDLEYLVGRYGVRLPFALLWYASRFVRQRFWLYYFKTIGRYGFSQIGRGVRIDGLPSFVVPCCPIVLHDFVRIGKRCVFQGGKTAPIRLEENVTINDGCVLTALYGITVGEGTSIGEYTSIRDYNHAFSDRCTPIKEQGYTGSSILIGKNVWIGRGCMVVGGVEIGDGAVIGANSVVTKDIPEYSVAVGSPARVLRTR
ncbi:acyltransferase [Rhodopirellula halodulae]|uniref:acyltransferase n=1 Tax=Rhodopirellula halodulae TaxID=2894198 RepID=UPI0028F405FD|nr:acyltransferase [Rhodopirellula sp. JC737]